MEGSQVGDAAQPTPDVRTGEGGAHRLGAGLLPARMRPAILQTVFLLTCSNVFMTLAWYGHLRNLAGRAWWFAALASWGIALFEYLLQVPANRIGYGALRLDQLKMLQEVISLAIFVPFAVFYMRKQVTMDFAWAGLCLLGAVYFIFRSR